jgi:hypothetical protein
LPAFTNGEIVRPSQTARALKVCDLYPVMPEPLSIASTVGARLAAALARPLAAKLKDGVLGTAEERAIRKACADAVEEVVLKLSVKMDKVQLDHVLSVLDDALEFPPAGGLPLVEGHDDGEAVEAWRKAFFAGGGDVETLPFAFGTFVEELLVALPVKLRTEAKRHGSPLFEHIAVTDLERLRHGAADVRAAIVPLAAELQRALDASYAACRATNSPYYSPHLLLTLLDLRDGVVRACFDRTEPGFGGQIRDRLARYVADLDARTGPGFVEFRWIERDDIRRAQRLAAELESHVVTGPLLLAALLDTPSNTANQLRAWLGPERFDQLRANALAARRVSLPAATPGEVFGQSP